jgi:hypothetical protein
VFVTTCEAGLAQLFDSRVDTLRDETREMMPDMSDGDPLQVTINIQHALRIAIRLGIQLNFGLQNSRLTLLYHDCGL